MNEKTKAHILRVQELLTHAAEVLMLRGRKHDVSKLAAPEAELFNNPEDLSKIEYNSPEYWAQMKLLEKALKHHYMNNTHHPEHYVNGIDGMDLLDIVEMFFDWKAASERHENGSVQNSINQNKERFKMSDQLVHIFENTDRETKNW